MLRVGERLKQDFEQEKDVREALTLLACGYVRVDMNSPIFKTLWSAAPTGIDARFPARPRR